VSRNGTDFASFSVLSSAIGASLSNGRAVLDGEIARVDEPGCPQFNDLLFHRAEPCFFAFDILSRDGRDLRFDALIGPQGRTAAVARFAVVQSAKGFSHLLRRLRRKNRDGAIRSRMPARSGRHLPQLFQPDVSPSGARVFGYAGDVAKFADGGVARAHPKTTAAPSSTGSPRLRHLSRCYDLAKFSS
jgi:hypothetical protein